MDISGHTVRTAVDRARLGHRARVLLLDHLRPRRQAPAADAHHRRAASRSSRSPPRRPRSSRGCTSIRWTGFQPFHARGLCFGAQHPGRRDQAGRRHHGQGLPRVHRDRRHAGRDQPADRHARRRVCARSTPSTRSTTTPSTGTPTSPPMRDLDALDPQERMARERGVTYVKLDGTVGILGNGAGLVMSTLDVVAGAGGTPANFLDVGGGAQADEIVTALEVLLSDAKVRAVLFNVFGGITRCDEVARGILDGARAARRAGADRGAARTAPTTTRAARSWPRRRRPTCIVEATMLGAAERVVELAGDGSLDGHPRRPSTRAWSCRASPAARAASTPRATATTAPQVVAGVTPGKGGQDVDGVPVFDTVAEAVRRAGRQHGDGVRAAAVRRRRDLRGRGRGRRHGRVHHRGHPCPRHAALYDYVRPRGVTLLGPELPGRALARALPTSASSRRRCSRRGRSAWSRARARSPTRSARSWPTPGSATRPSSASAATRSWACSFIDVLERVRGRPRTPSWW